MQQMHLDIAVTDLPAAVAAAVELGAVEAAHQPEPDVWRVLLDPAGHPFCLTTVAGVPSCSSATRPPCWRRYSRQSGSPRAVMRPLML